MGMTGAFWVGFGIFLSRIAGLARERVFAHYFGNSQALDALRAALKIPNLLQNLFGEGVLSASLVPIYARLVAQRRDREARKLAGAVGSFLCLVISCIVVLGVWGTPWLVSALAPGFVGHQRELTIELVRILFPATGLLVLSAWCLAILNSHRRFFLPYAAPILWNAVIIGGVCVYAESDVNHLAVVTSWAVVFGSALQFLVQLPSTLKLIRGFQWNLGADLLETREVFRSFGPVVLSRGIVQVSAYLDNILASFLAVGAISALSYAQTIYLLPIGLFAMSFSVSELTNMSLSLGASDEDRFTISERLKSSTLKMSYFVIPSTVACLMLGEFIVGALFQTGAFDVAATNYVTWVLFGYAIGLYFTTQSRLFVSTFFALKDSKTPLQVSILRVCFSGALGALLSLYVSPQVSLLQGIPAVGIAAASGIAAILEYFFLKLRLQRVSSWKTSVIASLKLWGVSLVSALVALGISNAWKSQRSVTQNLFVLATYGIFYIWLTYKLGLGESHSLLTRVRRQFNLG